MWLGKSCDGVRMLFKVLRELLVERRTNIDGMDFPSIANEVSLIY